MFTLRRLHKWCNVYFGIKKCNGVKKVQFKNGELSKTKQKLNETEQVVFRNRCHNSVIPNLYYLYLASYIDLAFDRDSFKHRYDL